MTGIKSAIKSANIRIPVNSPIKIGNSEYTIILKQEDFEAEIVGEINFLTLPSHHMNFKGKAKVGKEPRNALFIFDQHYKAYIDDESVGFFHVLSSDEGTLEVEGELYGDVVIGSRSIPVSEVKFLIPSMRNLNGEAIEYTNGEFQLGRHVFEDEKYIVTIDKIVGYEITNKEWLRQGGTNFFYTGELVAKNNKSISLEETRKFLESLSVFMSFLNGRKTSPIIIQGIFNEEVLWTDCKNYPVESSWNVHVLSWPTNLLEDPLQGIWVNFRKLYNHETGNSFIKSAIGWYLEANAKPWNPEGPLILSQTAMELIYNWLIVENKKILLGKDAENISAASKIRLVLSVLSFDVRMNRLPDLKKYMEENNIAELPEVIVEIRNALVHSQLTKREKIGNISKAAKMQTLNVFLLYIEVSLLYILEYKGRFAHRLYPRIHSIEIGYPLPWNDQYDHWLDNFFK